MFFNKSITAKSIARDQAKIQKAEQKDHRKALAEQVEKDVTSIALYAHRNPHDCTYTASVPEPFGVEEYKKVIGRKGFTIVDYSTIKRWVEVSW